MRRSARVLAGLAAALAVLAACQTAPPPATTPNLSPVETATAAPPAAPSATATITPAPTLTPTAPATDTPTATTTNAPTVAPTHTPASTATNTPQPAPTQTSTATPRPAPTAIPAVRLSVAAGGSAALQIDASATLAGAYPLTWRVTGMPASLAASTVNGPAPGMVAVWLQTDCAQTAGTYSGALEATVAETFVITRISLTIAGTVAPTASGARALSAGNASDLYSLRRGGPSTARTGPGMPLTFCRAQAGRTLTAFVSEAKTASGGALSPFPAISLIRVYGSPSPRALQTTGAGANAVDVVSEDSGRIEWTIVPGTYALVADASLLIPPERRPYAITIVIDVR